MSTTPKYQSLAIKLGLIPLVAGICCLLLWLFTRAEVFEVLGFLVILIGLGLFALGLVSLLFFFFVESKQLHIPKTETWKRSGLTLAILLANFPAAVGCMMIALHYSSQFVVVVVNESNQEIVAAEISGGGVRGFHGNLGQPGVTTDPSNRREDATVLPSIAAGESRTFLLYIETEGTLYFDVDGAGEAEALVVEGYVMRGHSGKRKVTIHEDGSASL